MTRHGALVRQAVALPRPLFVARGWRGDGYWRMQVHERDLSDFALTTKAADALTDDERAMVYALFDGAYRQANHAYLANSLTKLRYITLALHDGAPAGFGLADMRVLDLPRLPRQAVGMAGMCCIDDRFRRRGLFGALERHSMAAAGERPAGRMITCGRVAHPASFRTMTSNPTHIPRPAMPITAWQQEVGAAIAAAYGVADFDPATFVCHGSGEPIGYPNLVMDVREDEWRVFSGVDRDRGDSLLGVAWIPDAPAGWDD